MYPDWLVLKRFQIVFIQFISYSINEPSERLDAKDKIKLILKLPRFLRK